MSTCAAYSLDVYLLSATWMSQLATSEVDGNGVRCHHEVRPTNEQNVPNYRAFVQTPESWPECGPEHRNTVVRSTVVHGLRHSYRYIQLCSSLFVSSRNISVVFLWICSASVLHRLSTLHRQEPHPKRYQGLTGGGGRQGGPLYKDWLCEVR